MSAPAAARRPASIEAHWWTGQARSHARTLAWALLAASYLAVVVTRQQASTPVSFDPLEPRGRAAEAAIVAGRFADALPIVRSLAATYPDDVTLLQWSAEVYAGIGDEARHIAALSRLAVESSWSDAVCPALPRALRQKGDDAGALRAFTECVRAAPDVPGRLLDLGDEQRRQGEEALANESYQKAQQLDPTRASITRRLSMSVKGAR